jgi:hypothetical protein
MGQVQAAGAGALSQPRTLQCLRFASKRPASRRSVIVGVEGQTCAFSDWRVTHWLNQEGDSTSTPFLRRISSHC